MTVEDKLDRLIELMLDQANGANPSGTSTSVGGASAGRNNRDAAQALAQSKSMTDAFKRSNEQLTKFNKFIKSSNQQYTGTIELLGELDEQLRLAADAGDDANVVALRATRKALAKEATEEVYAKAEAKRREEAQKAFSATTSSIGGLIKGAQSGSDGITMATGLMTASVDIAGSAMSATGATIGAAGTAMSMIPGPARGVGAALSVAGPLIAMLGESASKLAKFGIEVLSTEVKKTVDAFNASSSAGALFADGMTGMRNAAGGAGLTVVQFSNVVKANAATIAESGLGVAEGAKKIGKTFEGPAGTALRQNMLKLGYSFEEQASLVADTMASMKLSNKSQVSPEVLARETGKYADNLRTISAITGEDAKAKSAAAKEQLNQLAFQQKMSKLSPEQQAATKRAFENMSSIQQKNFMDMVNFGTVINKEGAVAQALSADLGASIQDAYSAFQSGTLNETSMRKINAERGDAINKQMLSNEAIGLAGAAGVGGIAETLSKTMNEELNFRIKWNKDAIAAGEGSVQGQKNANDKLTEGVIGAAQSAQTLSISIEKSMLPAISKFAKVADAMLLSVQKMLKKMDIEIEKETSDSSKSFLDKNARSMLEYGGTAIGGTIGAVLASPTVAGIGVGAVGGGMIGQSVGSSIASGLGYKTGGISSGPDDGYMQKLHGTELIVPMIGDKLDTNSKGYGNLQSLIANMSVDKSSSMPAAVSIPTPTSVNQSSSVNIDGMTDLLQKQLDMLQDGLDKSDDLINLFRDNRDYTKNLMQSMS